VVPLHPLIAYDCGLDGELRDPSLLADIHGMDDAVHVTT